MKKWVVLLFICCLANNFSQTSISPQFSELKGMEDQQGNTHLFYRIYTSFENPPIYSWSNHIYHWDLETETDTLYIRSSGHEDPAYNFNRSVNDVDYWNDNPAEFIYSGGETFGPYFEGSAYIQRFDGYINYFGLFWGTASYIDISQYDDSLLYAGILTDGGPGILKSLDGGRTWDSVSTDYQFLSLCPTNENIYFVENEDRQLLRTTDSGNSFEVVDTEPSFDSRFYYDANGSRIYRVIGSKLKISEYNGSQFSWFLAYSSNSEIHLSVSPDYPDAAWLAAGRNLYLTYDGGANFQLMKSFEYDLVGVYRHWGSPFVYIGSKYQIFKWDMLFDKLNLIKNLEPPEEFLKWYPLSIGNKWIFENYRQEFEPPSIKEFLGYSSMEVVGDTSIGGKNYFQLRNEPLYWNIDIGLVRADTLAAKLFIYIPEENKEVLYEDFLAQVGDTIWIDSTEYKILVNKEPFSVWGTDTYKIVIDYEFRFQGYELVKNIGLYKWGFSDFFAIYSRDLKGCIIDGVVYGDTTTVDVEDETPVANEFRLEQNYPNPFNPSTVISYQLPVTSNVTLKIYDILGNEIATLVNEELPTGEYEIEFSASSGIRDLVSGIYFYQLKSGSFIQTKKMILIK